MARARPTALTLLAFAVASLSPAGAGANPLDHLQSMSDVGRNKIPNRGTSHILVIPIWVGGPFPEGDLAELRARFATDGGPGTFRDFWRDVSGERYDPVPTLVEPLEYLDRCPVRGHDLAGCRLRVEDFDEIIDGVLGEFVEDALVRLRDERGMDLSTFDVNGLEGGPDGYFDGVLLQTNVISGVAPPLEAVFNAVRFDTGGGHVVTLSLVGLMPPPNHEFAHLFGFIDLYGGPTVHGLMAQDAATLSAFSRQQIGWGEVARVEGALELDLPPVLESGRILRVGWRSMYVLLENRAGALHAEHERSPPGLYAYSVDESALPRGAFGFLDVATRDLYLPNAEPPYLDVALPVDCSLRTDEAPDACVIDDPGDTRELVHASGAPTGLTVEVVAVADDGTRTLRFSGELAPAPPGDRPEDPPDASPPDAGVDASAAPAALRPRGGGCGCATNGAPTEAGWLTALLALSIRARAPWTRAPRSRRRAVVRRSTPPG